MKHIIFLLLVLICCRPVMAQKFPLPDLNFASAELVSAVKDENLKAYIVTVKAVIKNTGTAASKACRMRAFTQHANGGAQLNKLDEVIQIPGLKAGGAYTKEYTIKIPFALQRESNFKLLLRVDNDYEIKESDENNNSSVGILIGL